jgi:hypothetical protein
MSKIQGTQVKAALKKATDWGVAVECGAGDGLYVTAPADSVPEREMLASEPVGVAAPPEIDFGNTPPIAADILADLHYEGNDVALALAMGTAGAPTIAATGSAGYDFIYDIKDDMTGLFGTYVSRRGVSGEIWENPSVKMLGFELAGEAGGAVTLALKNARNTLVRTSTTNTTATFANVTYPDRVNRVMFNQGVCLINRDSAAALAIGDRLNISGFSLAFTRPLEGDQVLDGNDYITEPDPTGLIECKLTLNRPQYETGDTFVEDYLAATNAAKYRYKCSLEWTGALIDGSVYYTFKVQLPYLHLDVPQSSTEGPGKIAETLTFTALTRPTAPLGMTGITQQCRITGTNTRTTDPLA